MGQFIEILVLLSVYAILVASADLTVGMARLLTLCQAAFCGIGAYFAAFFLIRYQVPFFIIAFAVMGITGLSSLLVARASIRLKGDYFVLATLAFQVIVYSILTNLVSVTGGPYGLSGFDRIRILGKWELSNDLLFALFSLILAGCVVWFVHSLRKSPFGRLLRAVRSDDKAVEALGHNVAALKTRAFFLSAAFSGMAGLLLASYRYNVIPESFSFSESITILTALFLGGSGNWRGPVAGTLVIVLLPVLLRSFGWDEPMVDCIKQIVYGLTLIVLMWLRPQGLFGIKEA
jgi:branched-chain amino acid transport system permease protein